MISSEDRSSSSSVTSQYETFNRGLYSIHLQRERRQEEEEVMGDWGWSRVRYKRISGEERRKQNEIETKASGSEFSI